MPQEDTLGERRVAMDEHEVRERARKSARNGRNTRDRAWRTGAEADAEASTPHPVPLVRGGSSLLVHGESMINRHLPELFD